MEGIHVQEGEAQVLFDAIFHTSHVRSGAPDTTLCQNYTSCRGQRQKRDKAFTWVPTLRTNFKGLSTLCKKESQKK